MKPLYLLSFTVLLAACSYNGQTTGYLKDRSTGLPIDSARVQTVAAMDNGKSEAGTDNFTDSFGYFSGSYNVQSAGKRPALKITITKPGYIPRRLTNRPNGDTVFMDQAPL